MWACGLDYLKNCICFFFCRGHWPGNENLSHLFLDPSFPRVRGVGKSRAISLQMHEFESPFAGVRKKSIFWLQWLTRNLWGPETPGLEVCSSPKLCKMNKIQEPVFSLEIRFLLEPEKVKTSYICCFFSFNRKGNKPYAHSNTADIRADKTWSLAKMKSLIISERKCFTPTLNM